MNINKRHVLSLFLLLQLLFISGCNNPESLEDITENDLDEMITYWSSHEMDGRLTGTKGNKKAIEGLEKAFKKIDLDFFQKSSYLTPFEVKVHQPEGLTTALEVEENGKTKAFAYGKDWMEQLIGPETAITYPITFQEEEKGKILVADRFDTVPANSPAVFVEKESFSKALSFTGTDTPIIQISKKLSRYLKEHQSSITNVSVKYKQQVKNITAYNVAGKISGKKHDTAIVISAHFDHVGTWGGKTYLGSVDNATGITALLNTASLLKAEAEKHTFGQDVIFAAFNGEELGKSGSKQFVKQLQDSYKSVININLDCIGIKDGGKISLVGEEAGSKDLADLLKQYGKRKKISTVKDLTNGLSSDHQSFLEAGYQGINISQENFTKIHTPQDTPSYTDSHVLKQAIQLVYSFVKEQNTTTFKQVTRTQEDQELAAAEENEEISQTLNYEEFMFYDSSITGQQGLAYNLEKEIDLKDAAKTLPLNQYAENYEIQAVRIQNYLNPVEFVKLFKDPKTGQIKKLIPEQYSLGILDLEFKKRDDNFYISILETNEERNDPNQEKLKEWELNGIQNGNKKVYDNAVTYAKTNNKHYKIWVSCYPFNSSESNIESNSYTKEELADFLMSFHYQKIIEAYFQ